MNREIKFRGMDQTGRWVSGDLLKHPAFSPVIRSYDESGYAVDYIVNPDTIGQFTGLYDAEGREVYEGCSVERSFYFSGNREKKVFADRVIFKGSGFVFESDEKPIDFADENIRCRVIDHDPKLDTK